MSNYKEYIKVKYKEINKKYRIWNNRIITIKLEIKDGKGLDVEI